MAKIKKKKATSLKVHYFWATVLLALASFFVYFFSFDSQAKVLNCQGNYYFTDRQIYQTAQVNRKTRLWLTPDFVYENRIKELPLVDSVKVKKGHGSLSFEVKEKVVVGYYVKDKKNYMLTIDNESIEIKPDQLQMIIHFPLLNGFSDQQREMLCKEFKQYEKNLDRNVIEKIAEMVPYEISFDKNMIKMTMQDGNTVYTSMDSLVMMTKYQAMLTQLQGESVCLLLDSANSAIEKVNCEDVDVQKRAEKAAQEKKQKEEEKKQKELEQEQQENDDEQPQEEESSEEQPMEEIDAYDWVIDEANGLEYSATLDQYRDPNTGIRYRWNDEGFYFEEITD